MYWITSSRRSCSKSTSMSGGSSRLGHEALEHHRADLGVDRGDAEAVAGDRIRGRAAPLAEDAAPRAKRTMSWTVRK
jgi:hypothetical protein